MKIKGRVVPLKDKVLASDMEFGMEKTKTGIILHSDNGKNTGIHPRWCRVWAVGPEQHDVEVGQWICVEHGRWTRTWEFEDDDGNVVELRGIDTKAIMMVSDDKPEDVMRSA
jgi:co-chaperonin GroES (HSP10)